MDTTPDEENSNTLRRPLPTPPWTSSIVGLAMAAKAEKARVSASRSSSTDSEDEQSAAEAAPKASGSSSAQRGKGPVVISLPAHSDSVDSNERQTSEDDDDSDVEMEDAPRRKRRATAATNAPAPTILESAIASGREHLLRSSRLKASVPAKPPPPPPARKRTKATTGVRSSPTVKASSAKSTTKFRGKEEDDDLPTGVFPCGADRCKMNFARWSDRQRHVRSQHMGITYHCPVVGCKRHYNRRDAIVRHLVHRGPRSGHGMSQTGAYNLCKGLKADWDGRKLTKEQLDELDDEDMSDRSD